MAERERETITNENVMRSPQSARLLVSSLRGAFLHNEGVARPDRVEHIFNWGANPDFFITPETLAILRNTNPSQLQTRPQDLVRLLQEYQIELEQLDFTERVLGLAGVRGVALLPEGRRAYSPISGGKVVAGAESPVDWNRLILIGDISDELSTPAVQLGYIEDQLGIKGDEASALRSGETHISFRGDGVGVHPGTATYLLLQKQNFRVGY